MRHWHLALSALCFALLVVVRSDIGAARQTQPPAVPENASVDELLATADKLLGEIKGNTAFPIYERALERAVQLSLEPQEARARYGMARVLYYRTQYDAAREQALRTAEIYERVGTPVDIGRTHNFLSGVEDLSGRFAEARAHAKRAVAAYESTDDAAGRARAMMQFLRVTQLDIDAERRLYGQAAADARAAGDIAARGQHPPQPRRSALHRQPLRRGARRAAAGRIAAARHAGLPRPRHRLQQHRPRLSRARPIRRGVEVSAQGAGSARERRLGFVIIQSLNAVATVYERLNDPKNAAHLLRSGVGACREVQLAAHPGFRQSQSLERCSLPTASTRARPASSSRCSRTAWTPSRAGVRRCCRSPTPRWTGARDALAAATKAVDLCKADEASCIEAFGRRAAAHAALGDAPSALADVNAALDFIEGLRNRLVPSDFFKQDFNHAQQYIYSQAIALQVQEKQERQALETAELARARAFLDLLASRDVQVKERDRPTIAALQKEGIVIPRRIDLQPSKAAPASALTLRGDRAGAAAASSTPTARDLELRSLAIAAPSAATDLVATAARLRSTLVVYWVGEDEIFIWAVSPDGTVHARRVPVRHSRLLELIRETAPFAEKTTGADSARAIVTRGDSTIPVRCRQARAWRALYDLLIQPIRSVLPTTSGALLTIVPQGPLLNVSFAALQNAQGRYLLEDYALHYAPAGAVLQFTAPKKRADARTGPMLVVADPALPKLTTLDRPLPRLPGARGEASAIARLVTADRLTMLQDGVATESRARDAMAGKAVIHFATHAIVSDDDPFAIVPRARTVSERQRDRRVPHLAGGVRAGSQRRSRRVERVPIGRWQRDRRRDLGVRSSLHLRRHRVARRERVGRRGRADQSSAS